MSSSPQRRVGLFFKTTWGVFYLSRLMEYNARCVPNRASPANNLSKIGIKLRGGVGPFIKPSSFFVVAR